MRELGLVTICWDVNVGRVEQMFDEHGTLRDDTLVRRSDRFIRELIWMAKCLHHGREALTIDDAAAERIACPPCGGPMNHHGDTSLPEHAPADAADATLVSIHACGTCGISPSESSLMPATVSIGG